jgi:F-box interacting protein
MPAPAEVAAGALIIPNDVIFEILSRTPMKSVCRFRCVSKSWRALVSDTVFVAAHESRTEPHLLLVANSANQEQGSQGRDLRLLDMHGNVVKVIKEVGFYSALCPSLDDAICVTFDYGGNTNLVDLPTGKVIITSQSLLNGSFRRSRLGCHRPTPFCSFGFGLAMPSGAYKAVRLKTRDLNDPSQPWECEVLMLADGAGWRQARSRAPSPVSETFATTVNSVLHFLSILADSVCVLRFDLESEEWIKEIKGPRSEDGILLSKLTHLGGTLCMTEYTYTHVNIWLMTDYHKETWTKTYTISTTKLCDSNCAIGNMIPLKMIREKLLVCCYGIHGKLQIYDPCAEIFTFSTRMPYTTVGVVGICSLHLKGF